MTQLPPPLLRLLRIFHEQGVEYLLVGGYAVAYHGYPRFTRDLDLWVESSPDNAALVVGCADSAGVRLPMEAIQKLQTEPQVVRVGEPPFMLDLITRIEGCDWRTAWARRVIDEMEGIPVSIISLEDLKAAKRAAGRHRDLDDLENLP